MLEENKNDEEGLKNFSKVLSIPIRLNVEVGNIKMSILDISQLNKGSIVSLNKIPSSEVIILANGEPFAKGDIVNNDGVMSVRITDVVSDKDKRVILSR